MSRAICLGEIFVDCFAEQSGVSRHDVTSWTSLPGGPLANVAIALAKLGNSAEFIGAVGSDRWGSALLRLLVDMGVGTQGVQQRLKAPTRQIYLTCDEALTYTFAGFSESDSAVFADAHLFADALETSLFAQSNVLVMGSSGLAYVDGQQSVRRSLELAAENALAVMVDINWQPAFWPHPADAPGRLYDLIQKAHFLKASEDEARWLFGTCSAQAIAHQLPHLKGVLITTATLGCDYWLMGNAGSLEAFDVDVDDVTGAADAFTAGFVHKLLSKGTAFLKNEAFAHETVRYASAVGALTLTRSGALTALPAPKEVEVFLYLN